MIPPSNRPWHRFKNRLDGETGRTVPVHSSRDRKGGGLSQYSSTRLDRIGIPSGAVQRSWACNGVEEPHVDKSGAKAPVMSETSPPTTACRIDRASGPSNRALGTRRTEQPTAHTRWFDVADRSEFAMYPQCIGVKAASLPGSNSFR